MAYKKVGWKDYPSTDTPINATNLDHMDAGILENAQTIGDKTKISGIGDGTVVGAIAANKSAIDANAEAIAQNTQSLNKLNEEMNFESKVLLFSISEGETREADFSKYKYVYVESDGVGNRIYPVKILNILGITDEVSRTTSSSYFSHLFFTVTSKRFTYISCFCSGYGKSKLYVYGVL